MILKLTVCKQGCSNKEITHHQLDEPVDDIMAWARDKVAEMNKDKAAFEKLYVLNGISEYELPDPSDPKVHDWQRTSFHLSGGAGGHYLMRCEKCGITGVKYDKSVHVKIDPQYKAKYYEDCSKVIKAKEAAAKKKEQQRRCVM